MSLPILLAEYSIDGSNSLKVKLYQKPDNNLTCWIYIDMFALEIKLSQLQDFAELINLSYEDIKENFL